MIAPDIAVTREHPASGLPPALGAPVERWRVIVGCQGAATAQMAFDHALAMGDERVQIARLFWWDQPAISWGWKQSAPPWFRSEPRRLELVEGVERPSGGGVAFHGSDVSISVVLPRTIGMPLAHLMRAVCESAVRLCACYGIDATSLQDVAGAWRIQCCLAEPSPYAVMIGARKLAGFALRRYPQSWLIQGSLLARPLPRAVEALMPPELAMRLDACAISLTEAAGIQVSEQELAARWAATWASWWEDAVQSRMGATN
ncbi:MAG: lipoate--protein ligase family protein [Candidatus Omnitrophica bacterium]|nr:lipoate--protein ligase family protein [Candidatus Omnitrophota bacterium]